MGKEFAIPNPAPTSWVLYRLPGEGSVHFISHDQAAEGKQTFVFHPFHEGSSLQITSSNIDEIEPEKLPLLWRSLTSHRLQREASSKDSYLNSLSKAIHELQNEKLKKVVLSRSIEARQVEDAQLESLFSTLCKLYPDAFVYLITHPETGTWMGASPETLLSGEGGNYSTISLAGTLSKENASVWTKKEMLEQDLVTRYIHDRLLGLNAQDIHKSGPYEIEAGKLRHLRTDFRFSSDLSPSELAGHLHPTPAVCGVPTLEAKSFILQNEGYSREYYTGYCGPITQEGKCQLFVNLRCMQLLSNKSLVYVGGGIVADSEPEQEWRETQMKSSTMLRALEKM